MTWNEGGLSTGGRDDECLVVPHAPSLRSVEGPSGLGLFSCWQPLGIWKHIEQALVGAADSADKVTWQVSLHLACEQNRQDLVWYSSAVVVLTSYGDAFARHSASKRLVHR